MTVAIRVTMSNFRVPRRFLPPTPLFFFPSISPRCYLCSDLLTHFAYPDPPSSLYRVSVKPTHIPCLFTVSSLRRGSPFFTQVPLFLFHMYHYISS